MANKGFIPSATSFIRQIRQNLSEGRYALGKSGFAIIKELVQNADDAGEIGASVVHLGILDAIPGAQHPLLRSPGMFVINDGEFESHDAKNIRRFGENTKAMEAAKIGKFGLGLKSIFHLCEAFFFIGPAGRDDNAEFIADILNPWSSDEDDNFHPEWDEFGEDDQRRIISALNPISGGRCFCLWIPLRQKHQLADNEPIQHFFYPDDYSADWLSAGNVAQDVAKLLPLLSNLRSIQSWSGAGGEPTRTFEVALGDKSSRRRRFSELNRGKVHRFDGSVSVTVGDVDSAIWYVGAECNPHDEFLLDLEGNEHWPSDLGRDPESGRAKTVREKAQQHASVCMSIGRVSQGISGQVSISWAVFLPLGEPETIPVPSASFDLSILLHGYFFVDAGRNVPIGLHDRSETAGSVKNDEQLRGCWNRRLADVGTLPLLPVVLEQLMTMEGSSVDDTEMTQITAAIEKSQVFRDFQNQVCGKHGWANLLTAGGQRAWKLFPGHERLVDLPAFTDDTLPWQVFPGMETLVADLNISFRSAPRLVSSECQTTWPNDAVKQLLSSVPAADTLRTATHTNYLADFVEQLDELGQFADHGMFVATIARIGISSCGIPEEDERAHLQRLLRCISPELRLPITVAGDYGDSLLREISQHDVDLIFVPQELDPPTSPGTARLTSHHAVTLLKALSERQTRAKEAGEREAVSVLAAELLQHVQDKSEVLKGVAELPLIVVRDCRSQSDRLATWEELQSRRSAKMLFVLPSPRSSWLQSTLADETVLLVSTNCFRTLFPDDAPSQCETSQIVETLTQPNMPALASAAGRAKAVDGLLNVRGERRQGEDHQRCIRYLLHAEKTQFHSSAPLLVGLQGQSDVWRRVTQIALAKQAGQWRLIDRDLSKLLRDQDKVDFGIQDVGAKSAIPLIEQTGPQAFSQLRPSPEEYAELLRAIESDDLCRQLPIHEDLSGEFVPISGACYWESDVTLPPHLQHSVTVLRRSGDGPTWIRQTQLARQLDSNALIETILSNDRPGDHWQVVMASLPNANALRTETSQRLTSTPWLPTENGGFVSPDDLIDLPQLADDVARLTSSTPGIFSEPGMLLSAVRDHSSYSELRRRSFPTPDTALSMLGELLVEDDDNHIGPIRPERFNQWCDIAGTMPTDILPCGVLLARAAKSYATSPIRMFEQLTKPSISTERIQSFLGYCRQTHQNERNRKRQSHLISVFNEYLRMAVESDGYETVLKREHLPSRDGTWKSAEELCCDNDGVAGSSVLHSDTEDTLAPFMPAELRNESLVGVVDGIDVGRDVEWSAIEPELDAASARLRDYFDPWQDIVPNEQIGAFLTLLGDDSGICKLAKEYLGKNRSIEQTRIKFGLPETKAGIQMEDGLTMMSKQRVVVELVRDQSVRLRNLLGTPFQAPRNRTPSNIFVGYGKRNNPFPHSVINGSRVLCFRLNVVDTRHLTESDLSGLLLDSAVKFIGAAYNAFERQTTFAAAWQELSDSDQLDISVAQARIIENGFLILDQLGLRANPAIDEVLRRWDAAQRLIAEQQSSGTLRGAAGSRDADAEMREAKEQLRDLLEECDAVQTSILEAVRERIAEYYQYTKAAVPFEIFQNADDASVELSDYFDVTNEQKQDAEVFHVITASTTLTLAHFGRRINQYPLTSPDETHGFDNDLWKMLVLSLSNKHNADNGTPSVTGKFGLGFKSCYLICQRPRILSGRLAFEVTGAMYPRRLIGDERKMINECRSDALSGNMQSTILQLALTDTSIDDALGDFRRFAHIAVVFARRIRRCIIINGGDEEEAKWEPSPVTGVPGCSTGTMSPLPAGRQNSDEPTTALLLNSDHGSLLFGLGSRQFAPLPCGIPTIWVTAPTRELLGIGFLINGPFALDVGRAQLAREFAQNRDVASRLGVAVGAQLCDVFRVSEQPEGWKRLRDELRLAEDTCLYDFWDSLFSRVGNAIAKRARHERPADALVREIFWNGPHHGAFGLYSDCRALPTRLCGDYRVLVALGEIRHALGGLLAEDVELFSSVSRWDMFQEHAPAGSVVSAEHVYEPLKLIAAAAVSHVRPLTIKTVLEWEFKHGAYAPPDAAKRIGAVVNKKTLEVVRERSELRELRELLESVEFKGRDNRYYPAKQLLLGHASDLEREDRREEERRRAQFAPDDRVLHEDYHGTAVAFFDVCRETLEAPVRLLADWVVEANDIQRQRAALAYLADGQLAWGDRGLIYELKRRGLEGTWLDGLTRSEAFRSLDEAKRGRLLELLPEDERPVIDWGNRNGDRLAVDAPEDALRGIHAWWRKCRQQQQKQFDGRTFVEEYERRLYPNGRPHRLATDGLCTDERTRTEWATVLLLGLMHTMGRVTSAQNREFLRRCAAEGWLTMFVAPEPDPHKWIAFVHDYIDQQVDEAEYFHWMRQFVGIFQVSHYLNDYAELFLAIDRIKRPFQLTEVTHSRSSSLFQGGGVSAPPVSHVLGLGSCFVVRELTRLGVLKNELAYRHCFVPTARIRDVFRRLGCPGLDLHSQRWEMSVHIHNFVVEHLGTERATFDLDFDIPFHFIADDLALQRELLHRDIGDDHEVDDDEVGFAL